MQMQMIKTKIRIHKQNRLECNTECKRQRKRQLTRPSICTSLMRDSGSNTAAIFSFPLSVCMCCLSVLTYCFSGFTRLVFYYLLVISWRSRTFQKMILVQRRHSILERANPEEKGFPESHSAAVCLWCGQGLSTVREVQFWSHTICMACYCEKKQ